MADIPKSGSYPSLISAGMASLTDIPLPPCLSHHRQKPTRSFAQTLSWRSLEEVVHRHGPSRKSRFSVGSFSTVVNSRLIRTINVICTNDIFAQQIDVPHDP